MEGGLPGSAGVPPAPSLTQPRLPQIKVMKSLSIAIVGCGSFGRQMADLLERLPGLNITAVCDPDAEKSQPLARDLGVPAYVSFQRCLEESRAAAVALFTPNHLHAPMAIAAAEAGKHIFCEKPMAMNVAECYAMIEAAEANGVKLMVGHKRRLRPQYAKMAEIVRGLRYGRPLAVQVNGFYGRELWDWWTRRETGGGLLFHAGVHDLDFLRHACGEVGTVFARSPVKTDHGTDFEDALALLIQFESGTVATLQVSPFSPQRTFRQAFGVHFVLERGDLIYDPAETTVTVQGRGEPPQQFHFDNQAGFEQAYRTELESFAAWVSRDAEPVLTGWDGLRCVEIMEAAQLSAYSGGQVQLPLPRVQARQEWLGTPALTREMAEPTLFARGLSMAEGPAFDRQGHLFVANCRARHLSRISPGGEVSHFLSTGGKPQGVVVAPDERLFISDNQKRMIFRADAGGRLEEFCGRYRDGSRLRGPNEIALGPDGRIYFTDPRQGLARPDGGRPLPGGWDRSGRAAGGGSGVHQRIGLHPGRQGDLRGGNDHRESAAGGIGRRRDPGRAPSRIRSLRGQRRTRRDPFRRQRQPLRDALRAGPGGGGEPRGPGDRPPAGAGPLPDQRHLLGAFPAGLRRPDRGHLEAGGGGGGGAHLFPEGVAEALNRHQALDERQGPKREIQTSEAPAPHDGWIIRE